MPKDEKVVQTDEVPKGTESTGDETPKGEETPPQPLTEERIRQIMAEEREVSKREIQSAKDKATSEVEKAQRRAQAAEGTLADYDKGLGELDPDQAARIKAEAQLKTYQRKEFEDAQKQAAQQAINDFEGTLSEHITDLGLDPNDERLDWGKELPVNTQGYFYTRQSRFLKSVAKIQKEDARVAEEKRSQTIQDKETELRKEVDSVDTSASGGVGEKDWRKLSPGDQIKQGLKEGQQKRK